MRNFFLFGFASAFFFNFDASALDVDFSGDLRYRHESRKRKGDAQTRHRHRVRARVKAESKIDDHTKILIGLATGSSPVSRNLTLDGSFGVNPIQVDLASISYQLWQERFTINAGKQKNPFYRPLKSEMIWDSDLTPEGINLALDHYLNLDLAAFWVEERKSANDSFLLGANIHRGIEIGSFELVPSLAYFHYTNTKGHALFDSGASDGTGTENFGNTSITDSTSNFTTYRYGYQLLNGSLTLNGELMNLPFGLYFEYVQNIAQDVVENTGWAAGLDLGKIKKAGSWSLAYYFRSVQKDAVIGAFADSNLNSGGSDAKGHEASFSYAFSEASRVKLITYIQNEFESGLPSGEYNKLQLDFMTRF